MDIAQRFGHIGISPWVSKRIRALSSRPVDPQRTLRFRRKVAAGALLAAAAGLAYWAQGLSEDKAIREWERSHPPTEPIWRHALGSRDFQPLTEPGKMQKASRALPMRIDSGSSVWISPDSRWVAVFLSPDQTIPERLYCWSCVPPYPESWEPLGQGWTGFNSVLQRLDSTSGDRQRVENHKKPAEFVDPREIHY